MDSVIKKISTVVLEFHQPLSNIGKFRHHMGPNKIHHVTPNHNCCRSNAFLLEDPNFEWNMFQNGFHSIFNFSFYILPHIHINRSLHLSNKTFDAPLTLNWLGADRGPIDAPAFLCLLFFFSLMEVNMSLLSCDS